MAFFRSPRARLFLAVCLTSAILLTQGFRVQIHAHDDFSLADVTMHAHVVDGSVATDHDDDVAGSTEVSKSALIKLLNFKLLLAFLVSVLSFVFFLQAWSFIPLPRRTFRFIDPPYLAPPGHAPPR